MTDQRPSKRSTGGPTERPLPDRCILRGLRRSREGSQAGGGRQVVRSSRERGRHPQARVCSMVAALQASRSTRSIRWSEIDDQGVIALKAQRRIQTAPGTQCVICRPTRRASARPCRQRPTDGPRELDDASWDLADTGRARFPDGLAWVPSYREDLVVYLAGVLRHHRIGVRDFDGKSR